MDQFIQFESKELAFKLIDKAISFKKEPLINKNKGTGKRIGLIFLNPSLRTRVRTQIAASNLGMESIVLNMDKEGWALEMADGVLMNKDKVEHIKDAAAVLGLYFDLLAVRAVPEGSSK